MSPSRHLTIFNRQRPLGVSNDSSWRRRRRRPGYANTKLGRRWRQPGGAPRTLTVFHLWRPTRSERKSARDSGCVQD
jgi:hypothetical protein